MTNDEIRTKIAELKGWKRGQVHGYDFFIETLPDGYRELHQVDNLPNWPESIEDAWGLLEEMPNGYAVWRTKKHWICRKINGKWATSDTAPLAICAAYIAWRESNALP